MENVTRFIQLYLRYLILTLPILDLSNKTLFILVNFYVGSYMLLLEFMTSMFQTNYDTLLFQLNSSILA
jgi:hypothetical protein